MATDGRPQINRTVSVSVAAALRIAALVVAIAMTTLPLQAVAYVLEGPHILELTADALGKITALQVHQRLSIYPETAEIEPTVLDETAIYVMPQRFRSDIVSDGRHRTHLVVADSSLTVVEGRTVVDQDGFDRYQQLLRSRTRQRLMRTLNQLGVETAISSLGRLEEKVVFVLGARYPDESRSQLAVDKQTFLPVRLLLVDHRPTGDDRRMEIVYQNWQKVQNGVFPFQVLFYLNGRLAREIQVTNLNPKPSIAPGVMDLEALKASVAIRDATVAAEQKQKAAAEVQGLRKNFE